jgi:Na+/H+ antiporter NhaD/arsenite permease-like protein
LEKSGKRLEVYITSYYSEVYNAKVKRIKIGVAILLAFILMVAFNDFIVHSLTNILGVEIDPHGFLSFIPYIFIVLSIALAVPLDELTMIMERAVEWSSIVFFIMLFMLSYTLTYTGVMAKLAYAFSFITTTQTILLIIMLISSSFLSSVLDNLSVIVAFTPIAMLFKNIGLSNDLIYFSLLFGGVFGGNYTPVGSTANIIAISLAEKRKIRVTWREWLKIAMPITSIQIAISAIWIYINTYII